MTRTGREQFPVSVTDRSIEYDCWGFGYRTFDFVRLTKFYCEIDYVRLPDPIERLVFDWVRLPIVRLDTPGYIFLNGSWYALCYYII